MGGKYPFSRKSSFAASSPSPQPLSVHLKSAWSKQGQPVWDPEITSRRSLCDRLTTLLSTLLQRLQGQAPSVLSVLILPSQQQNYLETPGYLIYPTPLLPHLLSPDWQQNISRICCSVGWRDVQITNLTGVTKHKMADWLGLHSTATDTHQPFSAFLSAPTQGPGSGVQPGSRVQPKFNQGKVQVSGSRVWGLGSAAVIGSSHQ